MGSIGFEEQVAIVTGSGRALGRAYALDLARRGAKVVINDLTRNNADAVVAEIQDAGGQAVACYESVSTSAGGRAIVETALDEFGGLHSIIHNAGIVWSGAIDEASDETLDAVLGVHLNGAFNIVRPAWSVMREQGYGRVVLISSNSGMFARDNGAPYAAAKAGVFGLSRALAHEGATDGIVVNSMMPLAQTGIFSDAPLAGGPITTRVTGQLKELYSLGVPPEDVVPMATYLASSACDSGGHLYYACGRGYAEVFVAITEGWWPARDEEAITAEEIDEHLAEIKRRDEFTVPMSIADEFGVLIENIHKKVDG